MRDPASQTAIPVDIHQPPAFLHKILQLSAVQLLYDNNGTEQVMDTWGFYVLIFCSVFISPFLVYFCQIRVMLLM